MKFDSIQIFIWNTLVTSRNSQCILVVWYNKDISFCLILGNIEEINDIPSYKRSCYLN